MQITCVLIYDFIANMPLSKRSEIISVNKTINKGKSLNSFASWAQKYTMKSAIQFGYFWVFNI